MSLIICCWAACDRGTREKSRKNASHMAARDFTLKINFTNEGTRCPELGIAQQKNAAAPESCTVGMRRESFDYTGAVEKSPSWTAEFAATSQNLSNADQRRIKERFLEKFS